MKKGVALGSILFAGLLITTVVVYPHAILPLPKATIKDSEFGLLLTSQTAQNRVPTTKPTPKPTSTSQVGYCLKVPVPIYHHIEPEVQAKSEGHVSLTVDPSAFENDLAYLNNTKYNTISAGDLVQALLAKRQLPPKPIVLTMDDGYEDIFLYAFPLLKKYNIRANLMIPTGLIGNNGYLTWDQLREMVNTGLVTAYDHTWSHYSLINATPDKMRQEILTAKTQLEQNLGTKVDVFAYPYGSENPNVINFLQANGFKAAFSTIPGMYQCDSFIMTLHRTRIGNLPLSSYGL